MVDEDHSGPWSRSSAGSASASLSRAAVPAVLPVAGKLCFSSTAKFRACRWVDEIPFNKGGEPEKTISMSVLQNKCCIMPSFWVFNFGLRLPYIDLR